MGAIIVFSYSHVALVCGQTNDGKSLLYIGGNQSDGLFTDGSGKRTISINPILKTKFNTSFWLVKPKGYVPNEKEKSLPILNNNGKELSYEDTH